MGPGGQTLAVTLPPGEIAAAAQQKTFVYDATSKRPCLNVRQGRFNCATLDEKVGLTWPSACA